VRAHGGAGLTGRLVPLTVDGLIYARPMVMFNSAWRKDARLGVLAQGQRRPSSWRMAGRTGAALSVADCLLGSGGRTARVGSRC
jgi:hypothetical protein